MATRRWPLWRAFRANLFWDPGRIWVYGHKGLGLKVQGTPPRESSILHGAPNSRQHLQMQQQAADGIQVHHQCSAS